jgi:hypothetical protein
MRVTGDPWGLTDLMVITTNYPCACACLEDRRLPTSGEFFIRHPDKVLLQGVCLHHLGSPDL